jgi:type IV pilus assembly protein PilM
VNDLIGRMRSTLAFYLNKPGSAPIQQVLLSGAGTAVDGVASGLADVVEVPVHTLSLHNILPVRGTDPSGELAMDLVPTAGLALGKDR